ncbi:MAG TPA: DUF4907 domain-containing protein [Bacteroidales bacterium]|nr:DUF4907 domain-containing protein [Bacteroidales bacterium]HPT11572.1 DUF4907 domain-containing protein [Bacteroidales bacterium]
MQITRRLKVLLLILLLAAVAVPVTGVIKKHNGRTVKTYRVEGGWGYSIMVKNKEVIHQPFIPAIAGKTPFSTKHDAAKTGRIVLKKLQHGKMPTLTKEELVKAGIITQGQ